MEKKAMQMLAPELTGSPAIIHSQDHQSEPVSVDCCVLQPPHWFPVIHLKWMAGGVSCWQRWVHITWWPAQVTPVLMALKRQRMRWTHGSGFITTHTLGSAQWHRAGGRNSCWYSDLWAGKTIDFDFLLIDKRDSEAETRQVFSPGSVVRGILGDV